MRLKKINCRHRNVGRGEKALEAYLVGADGSRRAVGNICKRCAADWAVLLEWATACEETLIVWRTRFEAEAQIAFERAAGAEDVLPDQRMDELLAHLESVRGVEEERIQRILQRSGIDAAKQEGERQAWRARRKRTKVQAERGVSERRHALWLWPP